MSFRRNASNRPLLEFVGVCAGVGDKGWSGQCARPGRRFFWPGGNTWHCGTMPQCVTCSPWAKLIIHKSAETTAMTRPFNPSRTKTRSCSSWRKSFYNSKWQLPEHKALCLSAGVCVVDLYMHVNIPGTGCPERHCSLKRFPQYIHAFCSWRSSLGLAL